jgi:hypothetical protein
MSMGSAFGVGLLAVFFVAVVVGLNAWLLVPLIVVALAAFFAAPIAALLKGAKVGEKEAPGGVPSSEDASYEPVSDPAEQGGGAR